MNLFIEELKSLLSSDELFTLARTLHDSYHPFVPESEVWAILKFGLPDRVYKLLVSQAEVIASHKVVDAIIMNFYPGERVIKYYLARERISIKEEVTGFEIKVNGSRLDVGRINGNSYAFEIKTELDSLSKLPKQLGNYSEVFEYVYVVAHENHHPKLASSVPEHCGIRLYSLVNGNCKFRTVRKPTRSPFLNSDSQIKCLSSHELEFVLKSCGYNSVPQNRVSREEAINSIIPKRRINGLIKSALKRRFRDKWAFIASNFERINPVDIQAFFVSSADPFWVYYKNSSIVHR